MNAKDEKDHPSVFRVFGKIAIVSCCLWSALLGAWWWHHKEHEKRKNNPRFIVKRIAARPLTHNRLPIGVLAELLQLDCESNVSIFTLRSDEAQDKLLACPVFAKAKVWRLLPGTLGVEYALRTPVATLAGVKNIGIDESGAAFFLFPYYAPKKLPSIVIPLSEVSTLSDVQRRVRRLREIPIALRLLEIISPLARDRGMDVEGIDMTQFRQQSPFRCEVVFVFSSFLSKEHRLYVRLSSKKLLPNLEMLPRIFAFLLRGAFRGGTIDLRYDQCAILSGEIAQQS